MRWRAHALIVAAGLLAVCLAWGARRARAGHVGCPEVLSEANRQSRELHGRPADISEIAKKLNTSVIWVEHCLQVFGRRARRPGLESQEGRETRLEAFEEEDEPEESPPEDIEEPGEREREERPERQRQVRVRPTPTFSLRDLDK